MHDSDGSAAAPLPPGARLGRYEIKDLLGSGGMGTVYRALDPSLGREVAIKALAATFRGDVASLRRFEREARLLASLSHPNVAAIYGFEVLDGAPYLILEKVEGDTLAQRLRRGPLSLKDAVSVARQVAEGLAEAHAKGVVHRDLKPSNVMLAPGGRVKLVDFGLAKSTERTGDDVSTHLTVAGAVVGTAPYMSPEQILGEPVDTRTDVWAFGCLLYESLTGAAPFQGRSVAEVHASVLRDEPDLAAIPAAAPPALPRLVERCLRKDPKNRLQHIGDARLELSDIAVESASRPSLSAPAVARPGARVSPAVAVAAALGAAVTLGVAALLLRRPAPAPLARLSLELPRGLTLANEYDPPFAVSPSGELLVVEASDAGVARLYTRRLDDVTPRPIAGTEHARNPFFSPDGRSLAFFADRKVRRVPLEGGAPVDVCEIGSNQRGGAWAAGTIVLAPTQTSSLMRVADSGGKPVPLTTLDVARGEASHRWPEVLPGGKWVLFSVGFEGTSYDDARVDAVSLETGERRVVLAGGAFARWVPGGRLVFARGGQLYAIRFDPKTLRTSGPPEPVISGVRHDPQNGAAHVAVSASGTLVYGPGVPFSPEVYLAWLAPGAAPVRLSDTPRAFRDPRLSPDGERIAAAVGPASESDLWIVDARGGTMTRLSFGLSPRRPTWTPDGRRIAVGVEKDGAFAIVTVPADGNGAAATLLSRPNRVQPCAFSNDGRLLVFQERRAETGWDLFVLSVDAAGKPDGPPRALAASPFQESNAALSRDGRWLAYESDEVDNLVQAHVVSFPDGAVKVRASTSGARHPAWGPRGELYYWDTSMHRLAVSETRADGGTLRVDPPRSVFGEGPRPAALAHVVITVTGGRYDVTPSGERFLVLETSNPSVEPAFTRPVIVQRFADALARKGDTR